MIKPRTLISTIAAAAVLATLAVGCSAAPDGSDGVDVNLENGGSGTESLTRYVIPYGTRNGHQTPDWNALGCDPSIDCCFPATGGRAWDTSSKFELSLSNPRYQCTAPRAYAMSKTAGNWWFYTICADFDPYGNTNGGVYYATQSLIAGPETNLVQSYSTVAPVYSEFPAIGAIPCLTAAPAGRTSLIIWDPNCPTGCNSTGYN